MKKIVLSRKQIDQLAEITEHFTEVETFTIESSSVSGIGPTIQVSFDLFQPEDTRIDITDLSTW